MAKEIDKFKKTYAPLDKNAKKVHNAYAGHTTNREHHKMMLLEGAKEVGRAAQKAKDAGTQGTELKDFAKDAGVLAAMKTAMGAVGALGKEETRLKGILKEGNATYSALGKLRDEIDTEIAARKKKANRKIASVDSKSLPDMEKLLAAVRKTAQYIDDHVLMMEKNPPWSAAMEKKHFDKWVKEEIGKTKTTRKDRDQGETDGQAFDLRNLKKHMNLMKGHTGSARDLCRAAEKSFKNRDVVPADKALTLANKELSSMKKIYAPYERGIAKRNKYQIMAMQQDKDGKYVLTSVDQMKKVIQGTSMLIKKTSRASI